MTSTKSFLLILTIMVALGGAIMYETIQTVEHIKQTVLKVNAKSKSKN